MNERLKALRKALGLTQKDFSSKLGISTTGYADIEGGRIAVLDRHVMLVCAAFPQVSESWLRDGTGPMFLPQEHASEIMEAIKKMDVPDFVQAVLQKYAALNDADRKVVLRFVQDSVAAMLGVDPSGADPESDVDAEVEAYRQELLAEKMGKTSSASDDSAGGIA